jgi:lipopolysaccharide transport system ATP-binding protein
MSIRISYDSHALIEDLVVYLKISTMSGVDLWSASTRTNGVALPKVIGSGTVEYEVPSLPLLEGTYLVTAALRNGRETVEFDHWENGHKFDVHQINRFDEGVVDIRGQWKTV